MPTQSRARQILLSYSEYRRDIVAGRQRFSRNPLSVINFARGKEVLTTTITNRGGVSVTLNPGSRDLLDKSATSTVYGYFSGGGWAFGLIENSNYRITVDTFDRYRNAQSGESLTILWRSSNNTIYEKSIVIGRDIPPFQDLTALDQITWAHDKDMAIAFDQKRLDEAAGFSSDYVMSRFNSAAQATNDRLVSAAREVVYIAPQRSDYTSQAAFEAAQILQLQEIVMNLYWVQFKLGIPATNLGLPGLMLMSIGGGNVGPDVIAEARKIFGGDSDAEVLNRLRKAYKSASEYEGMMMGAEVGSIIGATLGRSFGGASATAGVAYGSLLGEIGERFGILLGGGGSESSFSEAAAGGLEVFGHDVAVRAGAAAIGTVSSWLSLELGEALGLKGFGAELFTTVGSTVTSHVIGNLLNTTFGVDRVFYGMRLGDITEGFSGANFNLGSALGSAMGAFIGAKLGAMVVNPQTQAAVTLSSIGSAVGAYVAVAQIGTAVFGTGKLASMLGNMIVPGIGAFVGFVLGALIGNLFGRKKPKTPTANAEIYLDYTSDQFQLGVSSAQNGGNLQLVRNMAEAARDTLNGFLTVLAGDMPYEATSWGNGLWRNGKYIASDAGLQSFYGHTGGQLWVKLGNPNATQQNVASADDAVSKGVMWSIKQTQIIGGDIFAKRALANSVATDLTALLGDLQIASDYRFYAENRELINGYITGAYNSLNQGEKDYYAAHKATIDKAHTQGFEALDGNELAFYNGNKATIDKIISALEDQAIANPWIITLQRINELKLDQWNSTDFFGGLQGFLTSMGLESYGAYMENVRVSDILGGMTLSVKGPTVQDGLFSILPQALDKPLNNDLLNPQWQQDMAGWEFTQNASSFARGLNASDYWGSGDNPTLYLHMGGTPPTGSFIDNRSAATAVKAGSVYEFSVLAAQHRGLAQAYVEFLDANGQHISYHFLNGAAREGGAAQGDPSNFNTLSAVLTAPPGAVSSRLSFRLHETGGDIPFAFFAQPVAREIVNDVANYSWQAGLEGWEQLTWQASDATRGVNLNGHWGGAENPTLYVHIPGVPPAGAIVDNRSAWMTAVAGKTYESTVLAAQHRGQAEIFVEFYDLNKNLLSVQMLGSGGREGGAWGGATANYDRIGGNYTAPTGAAYRRIGLRLLATGGDTPFAFFAQPISRELGATAIDWSADGNALRIDDLAKIGYTKLTEGNTSGKDFLDFSQRTAAVGWSDWSQTTEYESYWDPQYGWEEQREVTVTHTGGDDIVVGSRYGDYLAGAAGWDWIDGGDGDDTIEGGDGNDVLLGRQGRDRLVGGAGDDYLVSGAGDDHPWFGDGYMAGMWGGEGNDTIVFNGGVDGGFGENGDDVFLMEQDGFLPGLEASGHYDGNQMDYVDAGAGSDTISYERFTAPFAHNLDVNFWPWATNTSAMPVGGINGVAVYLGNHPTSWTNGDAYWADAKYIMGDFVKGVENVTGSKFNDYLWGDAGNNIIKGGDGNDFLDGNLGNDILEGGAGADYMVGPGEGTLSYEGSNAGVFIDMTTGEAFGGHATGDRWYAMDHLTGSRFADELKGDAGSNRIKGLDGDDWIVATVGSDVYEGGDGLDTVDYSAGFASGNSTYQVWVEDGYWETDQWDQSSQWISTGGHYETQTGYRAGLQVNGGVAEWRAVDGAAGTHSLNGVEHIIGTAGDDFIGMTGGDDYITGGKGNDTLAGGGGSDTYYFNRGDGFDQLVEDNSGSNTLSFSGDVKVGDVGFGWRSHATGVFDIYIQGTSDHIQINGNVVAVGNNKLKVIDFNGAGQLDVSQLTRMKVGGNGNDVIYGEPNGQSDLIAGYGDLPPQKWTGLSRSAFGLGGADIAQ